MHIVVAQMSHETNTFSPVRTDLARFSRAGGKGPVSGDAAMAAFQGTGTCMGGYLDVCRQLGATVTIPVAGGAPPSGPVEDEAYDYMTSAIVEAATHFRDPDILVKVSTGLGDAMKGLEIATLETKLAERGW